MAVLAVPNSDAKEIFAEVCVFDKDRGVLDKDRKIARPGANLLNFTL